MKAKIAIVIPVYNSFESLKGAIKTLNNQTFLDWIAIVVNDGSTDLMPEFLSKLDIEKFIVIHLQENKGRGFARQTALTKVRELQIPYMCMLDSDDFYFSNKLEFQYNFMEQNKEITLLSSGMALSDKKNNLYSVIRPFEKETTFYFDSFVNFVQLPHASSIIRIKDIEGFNYKTNYRYSEDLDFLRRILFKKKYAFTPEIQYCYKRDNSFSFNKYLKSNIVNIKSFNNLDINLFQKVKYIITSSVKIGVVFILSIFGLQKYYLSKIGKIPTSIECDRYEDFKEEIL